MSRLPFPFWKLCLGRSPRGDVQIWFAGRNVRTLCVECALFIRCSKLKIIRIQYISSPWEKHDEYQICIPKPCSPDSAEADKRNHRWTNHQRINKALRRLRYADLIHQLNVIYGMWATLVVHSVLIWYCWDITYSLHTGIFKCEPNTICFAHIECAVQFIGMLVH